MVKFSVYLDTSSWNGLLSGKMSSLGQAIGKRDSWIPCYSNQSIEELLGTSDEKKRTKLDQQLDAVGARCLETTSDTLGGLPTGYRLTLKNREERDQIYKDMQNFPSVGGFGLGDHLQKLIDGIVSTSFDDIFKQARADLDRLIELSNLQNPTKAPLVW